jgi:hypothetical protein
MTTAQRSRPWYCRDDVVDEYKTTISDDGTPLPMLKKLKLLKATVVNVGALAFSTYAISQGGDATLIASSALAFLATFNGVELGEYLSLLQAAREVQMENQSDED